MFIFAIAAAVAAVDQASKFIVGRHLQLYQSIPVFKRFFHLTLVHNRGAAFGMFKGGGFFFIFIACLALIAVSIYVKNRKKRLTPLPAVSLGLVAGGTVGNLIDRLFLGHVVDFLDFRIWPVFNIADTAITCGMVLLFIYFMKNSGS